MPPKATPPLKTSGTMTINAKTFQNATCIQIVPAGNGEFAVTLTQTLTDQPPQMFQETYKGKLHMVYEHPCLEDIRLDATFLGYQVTDENNRLTVALFFKASPEAPQIMMPPSKTSIQLVK